ncbi:MAG: tetratricopeptide repeat protein [Myxococcota bacterium]
MGFRTMIWSGLLVGAVTLSVVDVAACPMPRRSMGVMTLAQRVDRAEKLLAQGKPVAALKMARAVLDTPKQDPTLSYFSPPLKPADRQRASRIAGLAAWQLGDVNGTLSYLQDADTTPTVKETRAAALLALGRLAEARAELQPLIASESLSPQGMVTLARLELAEGSPDAAERTVRQVLARRPKHQEARKVLGELERSRAAVRVNG